MGLDARVRYTKMVIKEALISLLGKKSLNRVTVTEICELAEINRATFYKYYSDPFDLLDQLEQEMLSQLRTSMKLSPNSFREVFNLIMANIQADGERYQILFSENGDSKFPSRIFSLYYDHIAKDLSRQFPKLSPAQLEWLYYFVAQGCCGILERWIHNGMTEPMEEVSIFADRLISDVTARL